MSNTRGAQRGVNPHPPHVHPSLPAPPACSAGLGRGRAPLHSPLSVLLCCTAGKAQPVPSTGQLPAAPTDKGSNPGSVEVQWCQKTQETGLNTQILNTKRFPAALYPPWAAHQTLQFIVQPHLPQETAAEVSLLQCLSPAPGVNQLGATSSPTPHPTAPDGCRVCHTPDICPHQPLYLLHPKQTTTKLQALLSSPILWQE